MAGTEMAGAYYNEIDPFAAQWLRNLISAGHIAPGEVDERSIEDVKPDDVRGFTQCHFFAGIGVWSHALRSAGWEDARPVWSGSCPCQPFSCAGKQLGTADKRHLWPAWFRLICECKPSVVVGEQVAGPAALAWLDLVSVDLEDAGYAVGAADLCAAGVGAPHIRQRLYWMGVSDEARCGQRGVAMALRPSGTGASLVDQSLLAGWPTPTKGNADGSQMAKDASPTGRRPDGSKATVSLNHVAQLAGWPTPRREDSESTGAHRGTPDTLHSASQLAGWSTPRANKWGFPDAHGSHETPLAPWPTPMAGSPATETYNEAGDTCNSRKTRLLVSGETPNGSPVPTEKRGRLNPSMSRWLMGLPVEWDLCAPKTTRTTRR